MNIVLLLARSMSERLTRVTSGGSFIPEIDGLRFIAIFPVVLHHMFGTFLVITKKMEESGGFNWATASKQNWLIHLISHGNYGVQVFFVISGFILALPFARQHFGIGKAPSMQAYFLRRISRLEPTYLINLSIIFLGYVMLYKLPAIPMVPHLLASMSYLHNQIYAAISTISDVTWSLEVEVQFYILAPVLSLVYKLSNRSLRRLVLLTFILAYPAFIPAGNPRISLSLIKFIHYFACGFLLADIYLLDWKEKPEKRFIGDLIGLVGLVLMGCALFEIVEINYFLPVSILLFFAGVFSGKLCNFIFTRKALVVVGGMCYTIYLYHYFLINNTLPRFINMMPDSYDKSDLLAGFAPVAVIVLAIVLIVCSILFALFERPFMQKEWYRLKRKSVAPNYASLTTETVVE